ncbi:hypothetical protein [Halomonas sp. 25-S5]|uniref:hypothetical protein n=1 Tax=Halomonas sp. 25-S5 TaxID=2994065 RepID=UPI002468F20C|nr:hypothetical protein [Halomonas sp. 25-S5]
MDGDASATTAGTTASTTTGATTSTTTGATTSTTTGATTGATAGITTSAATGITASTAAGITGTTAIIAAAIIAAAIIAAAIIAAAIIAAAIIAAAVIATGPATGHGRRATITHGAGATTLVITGPGGIKQQQLLGALPCRQPRQQLLHLLIVKHPALVQEVVEHRGQFVVAERIRSPWRRLCRRDG